MLKQGAYPLDSNPFQPSFVFHIETSHLVYQKCQNSMGTRTSVKSPFQKLIFGNSGQNFCKNRY